MMLTNFLLIIFEVQIACASVLLAIGNSQRARGKGLTDEVIDELAELKAEVHILRAERDRLLNEATDESNETE